MIRAPIAAAALVVVALAAFFAGRITASTTLSAGATAAVAVAEENAGVHGPASKAADRRAGDGASTCEQRLAAVTAKLAALEQQRP